MAIRETVKIADPIIISINPKPFDFKEAVLDAMASSKDKSDEKKLKTFAIYGLMLSGVMSVLLAYFIPSVIEIWYTIGSICIPGIILPVVSSYYIKLKIDDKLALSEMMISVLAGLIWFFVRDDFTNSFLAEIEPMLVGLTFSIITHATGLLPKFITLKK